jgi:hypothetical protein
MPLSGRAVIAGSWNARSSPKRNAPPVAMGRQGGKRHVHLAATETLQGPSLSESLAVLAHRAAVGKTLLFLTRTSCGGCMTEVGN